MELINDEAATFDIEIQDDIMRRLIEEVVVDRSWLIHQDSLAISVHWSHDNLILCREVVEV